MKKLPCPRCGSTKTHGTFCLECLRQLHPLVVGMKQNKITFCAYCANTKPHSEWKEMDQNEAVTMILGESIKFSDEAKITGVEFGDYEIEQKPGIKRKAEVLAVVTGRNENADEDYEEEYNMTLNYEVTVCPKCAKRGTGYFEGILQVRNESAEVKANIKEYLTAHYKHGLRLAKAVPNSSGHDYYLSDHRSVGHLAKQLHSRYGGELKISAQHFSFDAKTSKNLYRVNAFLEIPEFKHGDVVKRDDDYYFIIGMGSKVKAENLSTDSQETFSYEKGTCRLLDVKDATVTSTNPIEVLHPSTFLQTTPVNSRYAPAELDIDDIVSVAIDGDKLFLIPRTQEKEARKAIRKRHGQKRRTKDDDLINQG